MIIIEIDGLPIEMSHTSIFNICITKDFVRPNANQIFSTIDRVKCFYGTSYFYLKIFYTKLKPSQKKYYC